MFQFSFIFLDSPYLHFLASNSLFSRFRIMSRWFSSCSSIFGLCFLSVLVGILQILVSLATWAFWIVPIPVSHWNVHLDSVTLACSCVKLNSLGGKRYDQVSSVVSWGHKLGVLVYFCQVGSLGVSGGQYWFLDPFFFSPKSVGSGNQIFLHVSLLAYSFFHHFFEMRHFLPRLLDRSIGWGLGGLSFS